MKTELLVPTENMIIDVKEDVRFVVDFPAITEKKKYELILNFEKQGVSAQLLALYKLQDTQALDFTTVAHHKVPNTSCSTEVRAVLLDNSISNYVGKIFIDKPAQQTVSFLDDKVLSVGKGTRNGSQPILQIEADDVRASHGATTGNIDATQLYYLQSRGLDKVEAEQLIIRGFFEQSLKEVDNDIREKILAKLNV